MSEKQPLPPERMSVYRSIQKNAFDEKDYREACINALDQCDCHDTEMLHKYADRIVNYVKMINPRTQMSHEGAMEILAAVGRHLIFVDGIEPEHRLDRSTKDVTG